MFKLFICLAIVSTSAFASVQTQINNTRDDVASFLSEGKSSNCSMVGSAVRAQFDGRKYDFSFRNRSDVDMDASIDLSTSTVSISRGLLFSTDVLNVKYADNKVSEVELVIAQGSKMEKVVKCN